MRWLAIAIASVLWVGCSKKEDPVATPTNVAAQAPPETSAAASAQPSAQAAAEPNSVDDFVQAAAVASTPVEPNAPPTHAEHERAAAQIHKGNFKSELDTLEKEDLAADRK
jgi:hypothetical protein